MTRKNTIVEDLRTFVSREKNTPWLIITTLYILLAPNVDFVPALSWHDGQRIAQLVILSVAGVGVLIGCTGRPIWRSWGAYPSWICYLLGAALMLGGISIALAQHPRWAFLEWSTLVMVGVLAIAVSASWEAQDTRRETILIAAFYASALIYSIKATAMYWTMIAVGPEYGLAFSVEELFTGFSNVRFFGHVQTMLLPFLILPAILWAKTSRQRAIFLVVPALWWMLAIASGTRGSWVALVIGAATVVLLGGKSGRHWCRWQIYGVVAGAMLYMIFVLLLPSWFSQPAAFMHRGGDIISLRGRDILWGLAGDLVLQNPWFGIGPMHFANGISELGAHPHNAILQLLAEWGIPAAMLFSVVFAVGGVSWAAYVYRKTTNTILGSESLVLIAILAAITGAAAQAMVDGIIVMPVSQTLLALLCGWALGRRFGLVCAPEPLSARGSLLFRGVVLIAMVGIAVGIMPEIGHLAARESQHLLKQPEGPNPLLLPRFWLHGLITD